MVLIIEDGEVNNGGVVLAKPLSLPEGTKVRIQIEPIDVDDDNQDTTSDEHEDFRKLPFFGMWTDREDMRDSVAWVRKQREKCLERITRKTPATSK